MDGNDLSNFESKVGESLKAFINKLYDLSASSTAPVRHCLQKNGAGKKEALNFDAIMARPSWTNLAARRSKNERCAHRIDALYIKGADIYMIEFKCDSNISEFEEVFFYKFYECLTQLLMHGWVVRNDLSANLHYVVVYSGRMCYSEADIRSEFMATATNLQKDEIRLGLTSPFNCEYLRKPWKYSQIIKPKCNLDLLELMGCKRVLTLTAMQFDNLVAEEQWI